MAMIPVPEKKLDKLVTKMRHYNIYPVFLPDVECLHGEGHPLCPLIEAIVTELNEYLLAAHDNELIATYEAILSFYHEQIELDLLLARDSQTLKQTAMLLVITLTQQNYNDIGSYIKADYRVRSEVLKAYPELANYEDGEGLILLGTPGFVPAGTGGGIYYRDHLLYYHQFLRRNFRANLNFPFLNALVEYHKEHRDQRVAVAIDHLRLMPKAWFSQIIERDHAFGPPLAVESLDDPNHGIGLTVHTLDPDLISLHGFERTEFYWSCRDDIKTFQVEEVYSLAHLPHLSDDLVLTRYVHSQRDIKATAFIHLDGAVKVYHRNRYKQRHATMMPDRLKALDKIKVFRIDGKISDNEWSRLIGFFFRGNDMVAEYLNPNYAIAR